MQSYDEIQLGLKARGIGCYLQNADQLVVSNDNPAVPSSNSFWVTNRNREWYLATWLPAVYHVPAEEDICEICEMVFRSSPTAIYTIEPGLAERHNLTRLPDDQAEAIGLV